MSKKPNIFLLLLVYFIPLCLIIFLLANTFLTQKGNVYSKIAKGKPISILVAGDSIGAGAGASKPERNFANLLKARLLQKYGVNATVLNTSMGGNFSYSEYVRVSMLPKNGNFDLVILCCGENDLTSESLGKTYEALIRTIKRKYPSAKIISILESSQKAYTKKIKTIQSLAKHYGIPTVDTIEPFTNGQNGEYESLTRDGIHPNDKGYTIYADVLDNLIAEQIQRYRDTEIQRYRDILNGLTSKKPILPDPIFPSSFEFANFHSFSTNIFVRDGNEFSCKMNIPENAHIGIGLDFLKGSNYYELAINGKSFVKKEEYRKFPPKSYIIDLTEFKRPKVSGETDIKLIFKRKEQADSFNGIFISSPL